MKQDQLHKTYIRLRAPVFDIAFWLLTFGGAIVVIFVLVFAAKLLYVALSVGLLLYLGFELPRWVNRKTRNELAASAKKTEKQAWGFCSRDREGPWINFIDRPLVKRTLYADNKRFYSEWLIIHDGKIIVNPGRAEIIHQANKIIYDYSKRRTYAWDGCTPKRYFFWIAILGTPDWWHKKEKILTLSDSNEIIDQEMFWPIAHHASLVHDALYQYLDTIPIAKKHVDKLFFEMLRESGVCFCVAKIYHLAVRYFGAKDVKENNPKPNSRFICNFAPD